MSQPVAPNSEIVPLPPFARWYGSFPQRQLRPIAYRGSRANLDRRRVIPDYLTRVRSPVDLQAAQNLVPLPHLARRPSCRLLVHPLSQIAYGYDDQEIARLGPAADAWVG